MVQEPPTLTEYLDDFLRENTTHDGGEVLVRVSPEDTQRFGIIFLRVFLGWLHVQAQSRRAVRSEVVSRARDEQTGEGEGPNISVLYNTLQH